MIAARTAVMLLLSVVMLFSRPDRLVAAEGFCHYLENKQGVTLSRPQSRPELVAELLQWIGHHSTYDIGDFLRTPPGIVFCTTGQIINYESRNIIVDKSLRAAYDLEHNRIYLVQPWLPSKPEHHAVLLHELIHHVQFASRSWDCLQQPEYEAYRLQAIWLKEHRLPVPFDLGML